MALKAALALLAALGCGSALRLGAAPATPTSEQAGRPTASEGQALKERTCSPTRFGSTEYLEGLQLLRTNVHPKSFRNFSDRPGGGGLFVYPEARVAMCIIQKSGSSAWLTLFNMLAHDLSYSWPNYMDLLKSQWSAQRAEQVFSDPESTRIVFVRDPIERFLSGFLNRCAFQTMEAEFLKSCQFRASDDQKPGFPLSQAWRWLRNHSLAEADVHFKPQSWRCELRKRLDEYSLIGLMRRATFARDAECALERAGLAYLNNGTGKHGRNFLSVRLNAGKLDVEDPEVLKKFFTKEFARFLLDQYKEDYDLFRIRRPAWVEEATGEWFDRPPLTLVQVPGRATSTGLPS